VKEQKTINLYMKTIILAIALSSSLIASIKAEPPSEAVPPIVHDLISAKPNIEAPPRPKETAMSWDEEILSPSIALGYESTKAVVMVAPGIDHVDTVVSYYKTQNWKVTTKQTTCVWMAEVVPQAGDSDGSPADMIKTVLNVEPAMRKLAGADEQRVKQLQSDLESLGVRAKDEHLDAAAVEGMKRQWENELTDATKEAAAKRSVREAFHESLRKGRLETVGRYFPNGGGQSGGSTEIQAFIGGEKIEHHFLASLRIIRLKDRYVLYTVKLEGGPSGTVRGYPYHLNGGWFTP
jgi:hypothetical protein